MKKLTKNQPEISPAILQELPSRLAELEAEIRLYPSRTASERPLKSIAQPKETTIGKEKVVQFSIRKKVYGAGHTDVSYPGSNHARGVRHIRYYSGENIVLDIEGDYEDQQFGSNFRFQNIIVYVPGEWEFDLVKLTEEFRNFKTKRKAAFNKKRLAARG